LVGLGLLPIFDVQLLAIYLKEGVAYLWTIFLQGLRNTIFSHESLPKATPLKKGEFFRLRSSHGMA
jgi:hypothetical protein